MPWYFNLPDPGHEIAWKQLMDPDGFFAPYGPTTAERRSPRFMFEYPHECLWNGPSWPFATTQTLVALANLLNNYKQDYIGKKDYLELLRIYARTQHLKLADGRVIPWIDEDYNPFTGEPIARAVLYRQNDPNKDRGRDYNHSTIRRSDDHGPGGPASADRQLSRDKSAGSRGRARLTSASIRRALSRHGSDDLV